jgi:hypothetical protein
MIAEMKQKLECMDDMEHELEKVRKHLETAKEENLKQRSGILGGLFN